MPSNSGSDETIFAAASQWETPEQRAAYLDEACAGNPDLRRRVEELLRAADEAKTFLEQPLGGPRPQAARTLPDGSTRPLQLGDGFPTEGAGSRIGRYKLLQQIGEGGCGTVFMAEQEEPVRRRVALKVIKLGMDTKSVVARFEAERQALAMMDHPNIARVLDAGATDSGRPFFVMELVRGIPITRYCDENKLDTKQRLDLFIKVCHAIQHAHQKGIIHRDIKPSNILVTLHDGVPVPKVIDFGIAKATEGRLTNATLFTAFEQFIGTPAYMSPEQAEMSGLDIDTRSDIYALGVLLYELLTGKTPFDAKELAQSGLDAMRKTIREQEPQRPSTRLSTMKGDALATTACAHGTDAPKLVNLIRGDLDWIVMKCLEKDRTRRYDTANGLAADLKRHLENEPVVARPPSAAYKFQKAFRRNKLIFSAVAAVLVTLAVGVALSSWQAVRAHREARRALQAEAEAKKRVTESEAVSKFLAEVFQSPDPTRDGRAITAVEMLAAAAKRLETDLSGQPERRAQLQATLGATYFSLGLYPEAIALQEKVRDYCLASFGREHTNSLSALYSLGVSYKFSDRRPEAEKLLREVLRLRRQISGPEHLHTLAAMGALAEPESEDPAQQKEAVELLEAALVSCRKVLPTSAPLTLGVMHNLALAYRTIGHPEKSLPMQEEVLLQCRKSLGNEHPQTIHAIRNMAHYYEECGRSDPAVALRGEHLRLSRKVFGSNHPETQSALKYLGRTYMDAAEIRFANTRREEAIAMLAIVQQELDGTGPGARAGLMRSVFQVWSSLGPDYEADRLRPLVKASQNQGPLHDSVEHFAVKAYCLRPASDQGLALKAVELAERELKACPDMNMPWYRQSLGIAEYRAGKFVAAENDLKAADENAGKINPGIWRDGLEASVRMFRVMSLVQQGRRQEAQSLFNEAVAKMPPFPTDELRPVLNGAPTSFDVLIGWLAYKEAKALLDESAAVKP